MAKVPAGLLGEFVMVLRLVFRHSAARVSANLRVPLHIGNLEDYGFDASPQKIVPEWTFI